MRDYLPPDRRGPGRCCTVQTMSDKNEHEQKIEEEEKARQHERERLEREEGERLK
jgi:hypothetical protein